MSDSYLHPELYRAASLDGCLNTLVAVSEMMGALLPLVPISPAARAPGQFAAKSVYLRPLIRWLSAQSASSRCVRGPPRVAANRDRVKMLHG
jgi:hypothetical protein